MDNMDGINEITEAEDHTLVDKKDEQAPQQLATAMKEKLRSLSDPSEDCCIFRVPKTLRHINEDAYVPRLVSLGPFHHGNKGLEAMEEHKWRCFKSFIEHNRIDLDALLRLMKTLEEKTRGFYGERIALPSDQFVEVMLVDAIFVINFLLQSYSSYSPTPVRSIYHEDFFGCEVVQGMVLLENQLPFFLLQEILDFAKRTNGTRITEAPSITKLSQRLFECYMNQEGVTDPDNSSVVRHFVDFQRLLYLPEGNRERTGFAEIKSITELYKAGVIFKVASEKKLLDIDFENGVLYIPSITVSDITETCFRNLLAYDQCHHGSTPISDYFMLMGMLINTSDDVELLVTNGILKSILSSNEEVAKVFNNLDKEIVFDPSGYYYSDVCKKINEHSAISWHTWMATLKHNYLSTPWTFISVFAACILLVLTVIQTVCSVIQLP